MSLGIILVAFTLLAAIAVVYFTKFRNKSEEGVAGEIVDSIRAKGAQKRREDKAKKFAWIKSVDSLNLLELNNLRSKLIKKNLLLMKTGRDMKIMDAQKELNLMQKAVEEKIRTLTGGEA